MTEGILSGTVMETLPDFFDKQGLAQVAERAFRPNKQHSNNRIIDRVSRYPKNTLHGRLFFSLI